MSPRTQKQFKKIREHKRILIMNAALELFANKGFHNTSISNIAMRAEISKGLIYNYFENKEDLLIKMIDRGLEELFQSFDPNNDGILTDEEFVFFIHENFRILQENIQYWKLYFSTFLQPEVFSIMKDKLFMIIEGLLKILEQYFKNKGAENPALEARMYCAFLDGISINYIMYPESFPLEEVKKYIIEKFGKIEKKS